MELSYVQNCPTCGAPVELDEADRMVECPYCDGRNYMVMNQPLRFTLPDIAPSYISPEDIYYVPYLRFKGHIFSCQGREVTHKVVDTTHLGFSGFNLPVSLGLRPQAMKIRLLTSDNPGKFVNITESLKNIFAQAARLTDMLSEKKTELYHRSFVGETVSYVYMPTFFAGSNLMDGVLNRPLDKGYERERLDRQSGMIKKQWQPKFIPTLCPNCADSLSGEKDSLVLKCNNCESLWGEKMSQFVKIDWQAVPGGFDSYYMPFWKIKTKNSGVKLGNFADFLRLTNHPVVIRQYHEKSDIYFWVPAFKISPQHLLQLARNFTLAQHKMPDGQKVLPKTMHPVTLPLEEARQAIKSILAEAVLNKKKFLPQLPKINLSLEKANLVYLPFDKSGYDFVEVNTFISVNKTSVQFGRSM